MESQSATSGAIGKLWFWLGLCVLVALLIDFGHFHNYQHGDSIIPVLVSLLKWTPYVWEQARMGMLVPLIATPITDPLANLLVQTAINSTLALAVFFFIIRYLTNDRLGLLASALGATTFLLCVPVGERFEYLSGSVIVLPSLSLALAGLLLLDQTNWIWRLLGILVVLGGHWINHSIGPVLLPLVVARRFAFGRLRSAPVHHPWWLRWLLDPVVWQVAVLLGATGAGTLLTRLSDVRDTPIEFIDLENWPSAWENVLINSHVSFGLTWFVALTAVAALGLGLSFLRSAGPQRWLAFRVAGVLLFAGLVNFVAMCTLTWVERNAHAPRYVFSSIMMLQAALCSLAILPWSDVSLPSAVWALRGAAAAFVAAALVQYGWPSLATVRADLDGQIGVHTQDIFDAQCTHVVGHFFDVWPAVFHANMTLAERGESRKIWGIAHRCRPTMKYWLELPADRIRLAHSRRPRDPEDAEWWLDFAKSTYVPPDWTLTQIDERPTIRVLRP